MQRLINIILTQKPLIQERINKLRERARPRLSAAAGIASQLKLFFSKPSDALIRSDFWQKNGVLAKIKKSVLSEEPLVLERKSRLRWVVGLSSIPFLAVFAAFGVAPLSQPDPSSIKTVVENIRLPEASPSDENMAFWREEKIQHGDTVGNLLFRLGIHDRAAVDFLRNPKNAQSLYQLIPGKLVQVKTDRDGVLLSLRYLGGNGKELVVERDQNGFSAKEHDAVLETRIMMKSASIDSSLFAATDGAGLPDSIATQLADMFASDIDFHKDLRKGDHFTVLYEMLYSNGEAVKTGRILAAEFVNQGKNYQAVYFQVPGGVGGYYTPEGKSLRKAFLRSPLAFSRITSGFSSARFHPILNKWKAHKGVDYGAPIGTPVRATSDGFVAFSGVQQGYGNVIVLQHQGKFSTAYGHLSRFAKGLHRGMKVSQGDVIGYVGMTGLATGPHLHYEFRVNGEQKDPLRVAMPTATPITRQYAAAFDNVMKPLAVRLKALHTANLANLD